MRNVKKWRRNRNEEGEMNLKEIEMQEEEKEEEQSHEEVKES